MCLRHHTIPSLRRGPPFQSPRLSVSLAFLSYLGRVSRRTCGGRLASSIIASTEALGDGAPRAVSWFLTDRPLPFRRPRYKWVDAATPRACRVMFPRFERPRGQARRRDDDFFIYFCLSNSAIGLTNGAFRVSLYPLSSSPVILLTVVERS